jgi:hypothetical protein
MRVGCRTVGGRWLVLALVAMVAVAGAIACGSARTYLRGFTTQRRLVQIGLALESYYDVYHCFPPQYIADEHGQPMHSWRVLLLPYIGYDELYAQYNFDEPWNGPTNRLLGEKTPECYRSPWASSRSAVTDYVGVSGEDTLWRGEIPLRRTDLQGAQGAKIWLMEVANSDIAWLEPRDLALEQAAAGINVPQAGIRSNHSFSGLPVLTFVPGDDWQHGWIAADTPPVVLRDMFVIGNK